MASGSHLSIGEVLSLVQDDFPDVTISKIRFLESQGLLEPERTPSGYRKFYPADIDRLEWILAQQRDNFLPLKVIRERLDEWDRTGQRPSADSPSSVDAPAEPSTSVDGPVDEVDDSRRAASSLAAASAMEVIPPPPPVPSPARQAPVASPSADAAGAAGAAEPGRWQVTQGFTEDELAAEAGVPVRVIQDLLSFSMIQCRRVGKDDFYDESALEVASACRPFIEAGIEVRHLRAYKIAAEREAGMLEQLVMPLLKQRHADGRQRAVRTVTELADAGQRLHAILLQGALDEALG